WAASAPIPRGGPIIPSRICGSWPRSRARAGSRSASIPGRPGFSGRWRRRGRGSGCCGSIRG
ncbi:MAG: hypothetical protein FJX19_06600, partial [Alphaproteobacteria bacterium]|nr:hypothetical protein [Alphaproteobacteria bacterium]